MTGIIKKYKNAKEGLGKIYKTNKASAIGLSRILGILKEEENIEPRDADVAKKHECVVKGWKREIKKSTVSLELRRKCRRQG